MHAFHRWSGVRPQLNARTFHFTINFFFSEGAHGRSEGRGVSPIAAAEALSATSVSPSTSLNFMESDTPTMRTEITLRSRMAS